LRETACADAVFLTLTRPSDVPDREAYNRSVPRRFAAFSRDLRAVVASSRVSGDASPLEYARVLEMHRSGVLHVHAVLTGWRYVPKGMLDALAARHGFGFTWVKRVYSAGIAGYLASYMAKSHEDIGRGYRVMQFSRGWAGPWERATDAGRDEADWNGALEALDPTVAAIPLGMSWGEWADREIAQGRGEVLVRPTSSGWPARGRPVVLWDASPG
jgi:hypothetical protein